MVFGEWQRRRAINEEKAPKASKWEAAKAVILGGELAVRRGSDAKLACRGLRGNEPEERRLTAAVAKARQGRPKRNCGYHDRDGGESIFVSLPF